MEASGDDVLSIRVTFSLAILLSNEDILLILLSPSLQTHWAHHDLRDAQHGLWGLVVRERARGFL